MTLSFTQWTDKHAWNSYVRSSPQGSVFSSSGFLDCYAMDYELCVVEEDGTPVAATAVILGKDGCPATAPLPLGQYQQTILLPAAVSGEKVHSRIRNEHKVCEFLLENLWEKYRGISLFLHHTFRDIRPLSWFHYHQRDLGTFNLRPLYTGIVNLQDYSGFEGYLSSLRRTRRQEYQAAIKNGLFVNEEFDWPLLQDLYIQTFGRQHIEVNPEEMKILGRIFQFAEKEKIGKMLVCRNAEGTAVAATLFLHDEKSAYYLIGANHPDARELAAGPFLLLESIRRYRDSGYLTIDLVGINSPNRGDFKTSFNAEPTLYFVGNCSAVK